MLCHFFLCEALSVFITLGDEEYKMGESRLIIRIGFHQDEWVWVRNCAGIRGEVILCGTGFRRTILSKHCGRLGVRSFLAMLDSLS